MSLIVHCGGKKVPRTDLALIPTPDAIDGWQPVGHAYLADALLKELARADYEVTDEAHALAKMERATSASSRSSARRSPAWTTRPWSGCATATTSPSP
jgi:hypothetical protein